MPNNLVGYLVLRLNGPGVFAVEGNTGLAYNYILSGNGLFIQAESPHLRARISIVETEVRGLPLAPSFITLKHGKIPQRFWDLALSVMLADPERERYVGIVWKDGYQIYVPEQEGAAARVKYQAAENVVIELHSHGKMGPGFSSIDDKDEQGLKIYGVVGELFEEKPVVNLRAGVYGYWAPVAWVDIFEGQLSGVLDSFELEKND